MVSELDEIGRGGRTAQLGHVSRSYEVTFADGASQRIRWGLCASYRRWLIEIRNDTDHIVAASALVASGPEQLVRSSGEPVGVDPTIQAADILTPVAGVAPGESHVISMVGNRGLRDDGEAAFLPNGLAVDFYIIDTEGGEGPVAIGSVAFNAIMKS